MSKGNKFKNIKCSTGEIAKDYNSYLQTKHWKELRNKIAELNNHTCCRCYGIFRSGFNIHHNTYKRLGNEADKDMSFYCDKCHAVVHNDRKNKHVFNRSYNNLMQQKMCKLNEEQIEKVLDFIDKLINNDIPVKIKCECKELKEVIMPTGYIHYSKMVCIKCGKNRGWGKSK